MSDITKIDKNFAVPTKVERPNMRFYNIEQEPFRIYGVFKENGRFRRIPEAVARSVSEGVYSMSTNTAGGRVRFVTDSPYVAIHARITDIPLFNHMPLTGVAGLDFYEDTTYRGTFVPPYGMTDGYESVVDFVEQRERVITIHFPVYSSLYELYIGLEEGASLKAAPEYKHKKPIVSYGSSITQGGCASRPGVTYQQLLTRWFDCDHVNLGVSGNAKGEEAMYNWIKRLDMQAFIYDYDHNAPSIEHLAATHEKMFRAIREAQPELPIIIMSRPKMNLRKDEIERMEIIRATYQHAVENGDKHVYFLGGPSLMADVGGEGLVDNTHPTDSGFYSMAKALRPIIENILGK